MCENCLCGNNFYLKLLFKENSKRALKGLVFKILPRGREGDTYVKKQGDEECIYPFLNNHHHHRHHHPITGGCMHGRSLTFTKV